MVSFHFPNYDSSLDLDAIPARSLSVRTRGICLIPIIESLVTSRRRSLTPEVK